MIRIVHRSQLRFDRLTTKERLLCFTRRERQDEYEPISITWCECCNGHTQKSITEICRHPVKTEIIESVASGGKSCRYRITVL